MVIFTLFGFVFCNSKDGREKKVFTSDSIKYKIKSINKINAENKINQGVTEKP
jgi:hypothetical protein